MLSLAKKTNDFDGGRVVVAPLIKLWYLDLPDNLTTYRYSLFLLALCDFVTCDDGKKCIVDELFSSTKCVCKNIFECPFEYQPVCGSDHVTYASKCIMGMTACEKKQEINLLAEGSCPKGMPSALNV